MVNVHRAAHSEAAPPVSGPIAAATPGSAPAVLRLSVIVITLNEAPVIRACLERLRRLATAGLENSSMEIIVADGGSTDGTTAIAQEYARTVTQRGGRAAGLNAGASLAGGDVLLFLHADTVLPSNAVALVTEALRDPSAVGGRFRVALDNPAWPYRLIAASINMRDRVLGGFTGDQAVFVRAAVFRAIGGYAPLPLMEDLDFARRLTEHGRVVRIPETVVTSARRWERGGIARTILRMWTLRLLYRSGVHPRWLVPHYRDAR